MNATSTHSDEDAKAHSVVEDYHSTSDQSPGTDLSIAAILKGTATKPLTTFEKKAALINAYVSLSSVVPTGANSL